MGVSQENQASKKQQNITVYLQNTQLNSLINDKMQELLRITENIQS
jgi:hypothetical protein